MTDASLFGHLAVFAAPPIETSTFVFVRNHEVLATYTEHIEIFTWPPEVPFGHLGLRVQRPKTGVASLPSVARKRQEGRLYQA